MVFTTILVPVSSAFRISGGGCTKLSFTCPEGAWELGAEPSDGLSAAGAGPACSLPAPMPGVMGPSTPGNGFTCGAGASGTGVCCCARLAGTRFRLKLRSAVSAIAVKPGFTNTLRVQLSCSVVRFSRTNHERSPYVHNSAAFRWTEVNDHAFDDRQPTTDHQKV